MCESRQERSETQKQQQQAANFNLTEDFSMVQANHSRNVKMIARYRKEMIQKEEEEAIYDCCCRNKILQNHTKDEKKYFQIKRKSIRKKRRENEKKISAMNHNGAD